jgi:cadmium resistance protein CadD (predicted permease)
MEIIITNVVAFASTNIDDIFLMTVFHGNKNFKGKEVIACQYSGIIALIAVRPQDHTVSFNTPVIL